MTTTLTRSGSFDAAKLSVLEGLLLAAGLPTPLQIYGTTAGLSCVWPNSLTNGQTTTAQTIINAYTAPTDLSRLPRQIQQGLAYLALPSPTLAQTNAAVAGIIRYLMQQASGKNSIDGTDVT